MIKGIEKILDRAESLVLVLCGLTGASVALAIVCALGRLAPIWLLVPGVPVILILMYEAGLADAARIILQSDKEEQ